MSADSPLRIVFPPELPVSQKKDEIARAIRDHQVVIVAGETGSGKTTQLPKICLELGRESIGHTQPRRLAARTIAERIAEELGQEVGGLVGYQVRFTDRASKATRIKLMTDGILLNEMNHDRMLSRYDTIIIDEAHERSLNIDFLLGYLKQLLPRRPDLKVIITSATIDPESFARHFADAQGTSAPIVEVSGRTFPVEIRYRPLAPEAPTDDPDDPDETDERRDRSARPARAPVAPGASAPEPKDLLEAIGDALDELAREAPGDVLVFLSGETEIRDAEEALRGRLASSGRIADTEVLPLYGRLSAADQHKVFQRSSTPGIRRRVILSTNVAETSLTVPGIKYVIDAGTARISRYSVRSKVQRLPIEAISQASANQRSGRSGRTSDGIAIRLYSQEDFERRPEFTDPEILRTNLAAVILQMISLDLGDIASFPFLQPPDSRGIKDGLDLLAELGATASNRATVSNAPQLTRIGRDLARLPIEPRFARMVVESKRTNTSREVLAIVAGLTIQDPRERPLEKRGRADELHARFADPTSDFLTLLNLWNYLDEKQRELSSSAFRRLCKAEFLNYLRIREWQDVYRQLRQLAKPLGLTLGEPSVNPDGIHRSLLSGLLSQIGLRDQAKRDYLGARQTRFMIFPGSTLAKKQPSAVMSAELVETSRLFARMNAAIDPAWAESLAGDLVKRSYSEPHWEKKQGAAVAYERVTLFGVPIVARRRIQFARVDPEYARELFIRHALVEGEWESQQAFDRANRAFRRELEQLEERSRRRDILLDDEAVFEFYQARIPRDVLSQRTFEGWWKKARHDDPDLLTMTLETLLPEGAPEVDETEFPAMWQQGDQRLALSYRFEPGADDDGVTATVPLALLPRLEERAFESQVPGFRRELVVALIRVLPKRLRVNFVPATDWAGRLLDEIPDAQGTSGADAPAFLDALAKTMTRLAHVQVTAADFERDRLPEHLRVTFRVVDERGRTVGAGKDLAALQSKLADAARASIARASGAVGGGSGAGLDPASRVASAGARRGAPAGPAGAGGGARAGAAGGPSGPGGPSSGTAGTPSPRFAERTGLTTWDVGDLPRHVDTAQHGGVIRAYPALVDQKTSVSLRLLATADEQQRTTPAGVLRLLQLAVPSPASYVRDHLTQNEKLLLATSPYQNVNALFDDAMLACAEEALRALHPDGLVWSAAEFEAVRDRLSKAVLPLLDQTITTVVRILSGVRDVERAIKSVTSMALLPAVTDAREQLAALVFPGFVARTGLARLGHLPRYLAGIVYRLEKLSDNPARDRAWMNEVQTATARYTDAGGSIPLAPHSPENLVRARWLLEELRIGLFAQPLGTAEPASLQRITKLLA
ncbi:ATP-dependent RNA helicase HrpA [Herbiconiux sp. KACC 21604]|uniref:ATP-dependent RNA helicase HrpA n=1 Tax=unclassified Herbiconiux TaxID=2618217 RepID=UPI001492C0F0|nr:ATP-dependent RNA helicase HrpA [Herbiconiux sp. SALV-R1]QJU52822.1 ATP-dependent RNA helicase HrpA [Herbiconiux sp. SALV-R1]WPO87735.1 ATP-dependent RNA helicase HrpA [Herbiconiux sp. KACC 21604]